MSSRSWVEIDEDRLAENYRVVREAAGEQTDVLAVVKANAYGHGLEKCAAALARAGGSTKKRPAWLGVNNAAEGVRARRALEAVKRKAGPSTQPRTLREAALGMTDFSQVEILVMCGVFADEVASIAEHGLTPVVWTKEQVGWLAEAARGRVRPMRVHVEIETGMGRQGVRPGAELEELLRAIAAAGLEIDGMCTHFASAEVAGSERTREQKERFEEAVRRVREFGASVPTSQNRDVGHRILAGDTIRWVHAGSSASVDVGEDAVWLEGLARTMGARAMVRCGLAMYGYALPAVRERGAKAVAEGAGGRIREKLKPVMTWKTRVLDVREVQAGEAIGYNATYVAKDKMRVALLPVGYADGLRRELSATNDRAGGWVMARDADGAMRRANIVGRVSMNLTTVDVTEIGSREAGGVRVGDEVVLLGDGVTADDHARLAGTIAYEILCGVGA